MSIFRIAPLGTCRIHTPLRRGATRFPYRLSLARNYGFVHSSREVLAQLAVVQGGPPVPKNLWPLVYRPDTADDFTSAPVVVPDLYMVEISSIKHVNVDDVPVQINYLVRHFAEFFADTRRAVEYWRHVRRDSDAERRVWLESLPAFAALAPDDKHILARVRQHILSEEEIAADMAAIVDRAGNVPVQFVTHVNALTPDGEVIASRNRLIALVARTAKALDVLCHNPTGMMEKIGQPRAMEKGGLDLTHYTPAFADDLIGRWFRQAIAPLANVAPDEAGAKSLSASVMVAKVSKLIEAGDLAGAANIAWAEVRAGEQAEDHLRLLAQISARLHDHERVISLLDAVRKADGGNEDDTILLMRAHIALGQHQQALRMAEALMADAPETAELLFVCASAAEALGLADKARFYWQRLLTISADQNLVPESWLCASVQNLWLSALAANDQGRLAYLATAGRALPAAEVWHMAEQAVAAGLYRPAAALLAPHVGRADADRKLKVWALSQARMWVTQGLDTLDDPVVAAPPITAAALVAPQSPWAERAVQRLGITIRNQMRAAHAAGDPATVLDLVRMAAADRVIVPGVESLVARAATDTGETATALAYLQTVVAAQPTPRARLHLARVAVKAGAYDVAVAAYAGLIADPAASTDERDNASVALTKLISVSVRFVRERVADGEAASALTLLRQLAEHAADADERIARERWRIRQQLRGELGSPLADPERTEQTAMLAAAEFPDDADLVNRAARATMRAGRFAAAGKLWRQLADLGEHVDTAHAMATRCDRFLDRQREAA